MNWFRDLSLPNKLSLSRILVVPLLVLLLAVDRAWLSLIAGLLFIAATVTDIIDGYLARKHNKISQMGKLLDPLADKLLVITTLTMLLYLGRIHFFFVLLLIGREFAVNSLRGIATQEGVVIAASQIAKFKTTTLNIALACLILGEENDLFGVQWFAIGELFLVVATVIALVSAYQYFVSYRVGSMAKAHGGATEDISAQDYDD